MLLFIDSGDHHASALQKWTYVGTSGDFNPTSYAGQGRFGTNPAFYGWARQTVGKDLGANYNEVVAGGALVFAGDSNFGQHNYPTFSFYDSGTRQMRLNYDVTAGYLHVYRGASTVLQSIPYTFHTTQYVFVEFKAKIHPSTGSWEVRIDGDTIASQSGVNTQGAGTNNINRVYLGDAADGQQTNVYYDDIYIVETAGAAPNDFLGDCKVVCLKPNGNGNYSQWDGSDGNSTDNYLLVDETTPNDDTDYVQTDVLNEIDTYAFENLTAASGTVHGVQVLPYAKKTDAGSRKIAAVARLSGTDVVGADKTLSSSYAYQPTIIAKPGGGSWTISDVNSAEFGVKVTL